MISRRYLTLPAAVVALAVAMAALGGPTRTAQAADAGVTVTPQAITIEEGGSGSFTVQLNTAPSIGSVTITSTSDSPDCLITSTNPVVLSDETPVTVTVQTTDDAVPESDTSCTITNTLSNVAAPEYVLVTADSVTVTIIDNDTVTPPGITVDPQQLALVEGTNGSYNVLLNSEPGGTVTVSIIPSDVADCTVDQPVLMFNESNWNAPQTVQVTAGDDGVAAGNRTCTIGHTATGGGYDGVTAQVQVNVLDDDAPPGATVTPQTIALAEGSGGSYSVVLASPPSGDVTIAPAVTAGGTDCSVSGPVTFNATNWFMPQSITVTAIDDAEAEGLETCTITHQATSADANYDGIPIPDVVVNITDNDAGSAINVRKFCFGDLGGATFSVDIGGDPQPIRCGQVVPFTGLPAGAYTLTETIDGGNDEAFTTFITCGEAPVERNTITVELAEGQVVTCVLINGDGELRDLLCPCPAQEIDVGNNNTNVIDLDNDNTNTNANNNENENENENENTNENNNVNTNTQNQENKQDQKNENTQTNNIDASPKIDIKLD